MFVPRASIAYPTVLSFPIVWPRKQKMVAEVLAFFCAPFAAPAVYFPCCLEFHPLCFYCCCPAATGGMLLGKYYQRGAAPSSSQKRAQEILELSLVEWWIFQCIQLQCSHCGSPKTCADAIKWISTQLSVPRPLGTFRVLGRQQCYCRASLVQVNYSSKNKEYRILCDTGNRRAEGVAMAEKPQRNQGSIVVLKNSKINMALYSRFGT